MDKLKPFAFVLLGAFIYALGHPNLFGFYLPIGPLIGTGILYYSFIKAEKTKQRILLYLTFNLFITAFSFYWITQTLQEFGQLPFIVAAMMNTLFSLIFTPHNWVVLGLYHYLQKKEIPLLTNGLTIGLTALCVTLIEYFIPQQFAIYLGQPWIVISQYLGLAPIFGLAGFSFISYLLIFESLSFVFNKKISKLNIALALIFIVANPLAMPKEKKVFKELNIRVVQANISNFLKVDSESGSTASVTEVLRRYRDLSLEPYQENKKLDLIVWPETAYPFAIETKETGLQNANVPRLLSMIAKKTNSEVLFGGYDNYRENPKAPYFQTDYNAAFLLNDLGKIKEVYHKQGLIPFGETLPLGPLNETISEMIPTIAFFGVGEKFSLFNTRNKMNFISTICYEVLSPEFLREYLNSVSVRPELMINLTNDSWYGNTVEPEQHLFLTKWRTIEFNLPLLRSTNTGISTFINAKGKEIKRLNYEETGNLDLSLKLNRNEATFYQVWGIFALLFLCLPYFIIHILLLKLRHAKNK